MMAGIKASYSELEDEAYRQDIAILGHTRRVDYLVSGAAQFIENGYEIAEEVIELGAWWKEIASGPYSFEQRIAFRRDYSARPQLFLTFNKVRSFFIKNKADTSAKITINVSVRTVKIMTSYFTVAVEVACDTKITEENIKEDSKPTIALTYIALKRHN